MSARKYATTADLNLRLDPEIIAPDREQHSPALDPETTLREIFTQALAGGPIRLPPGAKAAQLRAALALDSGVIARIFAEAKAASRPAALVSAGPDWRGRQRFACLIVVLMAAGIGFYRTQSLRHLPKPPVSLVQLFASAATDKNSYAALAARAAAGNAAAQFDLANLFDPEWEKQETVVTKNSAQAVAWYQRAAAGGNALAANNLGYAYEFGQGVPADITTALKWYGVAAKAGQANAQNSLGYHDQYGLGVPQNAGLAVQWYQKAAAQGLGLAQNNLGAAYESGSGVAPDIGQAVKYFQLAADQNEPDAENRLGYLYYTGTGVRQDDARALQYFQAAAKQGLAAAQANLGLMYLMGQGAAANKVTAASWLLLAQERGDTGATVALQKLAPRLSAVQMEGAVLIARDWDAANTAEK